MENEAEQARRHGDSNLPVVCPENIGFLRTLLVSREFEWLRLMAAQRSVQEKTGKLERENNDRCENKFHTVPCQEEFFLDPR